MCYTVGVPLRLRFARPPPLSGEANNNCAAAGVSEDFRKEIIMDKKESFTGYNASLKENARNLRKHMTDQERRLWYEFLRQHRTIGVCGLRSKIFRQVVQKDRRLAGASQEIFVQHDGNRFKQGVRRDLCGVALRNYPVKWYRQRSIGSYIADFYCSKASLIVELDGSQHYEPDGMAYDLARTKALEEYGLTVVRIPNSEFRDNFNGVCEYIDRLVKERI